MKNLKYINHPSSKNINYILDDCDFLINVFEERQYCVDNEKLNYLDFLKQNSSKNIYLISKIKHYSLYSNRLFNEKTLENFFNCIDFVKKHRDKKIIIHCRSGLHRSKMIYDAIYFWEKKKHNQIENMLIPNCSNEYNFFNITISEMENRLLL
jgi:rhodanese-related sulfurtransferase